MTFQFEWHCLSKPEDAQQLGVILTSALTANYPTVGRLSLSIGLENFRLIRQEQIIGGLAILHLGQWYNLLQANGGNRCCWHSSRASWHRS